ncbi:MAG: hydrogenase iron-sulfur subunit [Bacteroidales bacterium]|nr:hydrogenase iron-sulfur subunit [Bacteroidales bacterium]
MINQQNQSRILIFSTEKISDPAIDLAGLLKMHYSPRAYNVSIPCSSAIKPRWILHALDQGFDGVFIAADGTDCPYGEKCTTNTGNLVTHTHQLMKEKGILPRRLKMAAICSVCSEAFVKHIQTFTRELSELQEQGSEVDNP